jgi:RNA polymerase sigma-70 factor (ECF subfamily)
MTIAVSGDERAESDDIDLILRMASKDANALNVFYRRYHRLAFALVFRIAGNREDAEEVLADVFLQVWQQAARYNPARGKPVAWLITIARTRAIDRLRSSDRQLAQAAGYDEKLENKSSGVEQDAVFVTETQSAVRAALQTLPEQQKIALEMAYFRGMSHTEIAAALGQPLGTVKDRIRSGIMHLRKRLRAYL